MKDEPTQVPTGLTILGRCGLTPAIRLVSDRVASWEWQSHPRREPKPPRERLGSLAQCKVKRRSRRS